MPPSFKSRIEHETTAGKKRRCKTTSFKDTERRQCSKRVLPDTQKLLGLVSAFKEKVASSSTHQFTMWHLQLKLSKEMVLMACSLLGFIDLVADLEELAADTPKDMLPLIDALIDECQDALVDTEEEQWVPDDSRDTKTRSMVEKAAEAMVKTVSMVFKSKSWIKADERFDILHACCALFEATDDLVKSATSTGVLELDSVLEALLEDAVSRCDDQTMDEYLDVDCENEEEDEEDDE